MAEISSGIWGTSANLNGFRVLASLLQSVAQRRSTKLCTMFGRLLGWYTIYTFSGGGLLPPKGILQGAKFTLRPSLALSYIGSVTARHSSSGRQPNFVALSRGRHLPGRLPRWASAHILVSNLPTFVLCSALRLSRPYVERRSSNRKQLHTSNRRHKPYRLQSFLKRTSFYFSRCGVFTRPSHHTQYTGSI